ncbi:ankyrin repeat-containing protein NPR4-like [Rutidosis leptorrhynchoides]|uniref:ankyrin repeat-containing protein NPR4-like n=1 Tax=Rutidosis leptorrhynchoides TaxID=125765 RepID=UPI003A99ABDB
MGATGGTCGEMLAAVVRGWRLVADVRPFIGKRVCNLIKEPNPHFRNIRLYYSKPVFEVTRENAYKVVTEKEVEEFVCPLNTTQKNLAGETPQMVFSREHKELVIEGEEWTKKTAESYMITAALITTIVFAAAITVPGGNSQNNGTPLFTNKVPFTIFAIADALSLFTAVKSLLIFLSILTTRFAEQDFLFKLPERLIIGLATLFITTTAMIIAFGATLFMVFGQESLWVLIPIGASTCLPIISFVTLQLPLIIDLISATYGRSIFDKRKPVHPFY